nr:PREDICTED: progestin and adipoQ receptor family member 3-like isoform X2 [Equus przewalskii]
MHQKLLKSAHYIELGSYQYWPVLVPRGIRLYTYEQIPVSLKDNPYITDGYRAYLPSRLCIKSVAFPLFLLPYLESVSMTHSQKVTSLPIPTWLQWMAHRTSQFES